MVCSDTSVVTTAEHLIQCFQTDGTKDHLTLHACRTHDNARLRV